MKRNYMKKIILACTVILLGVSALSQKTSTTKPISTGTINIEVPNFADPAIKRFYEAYTSHLKKSVIAARNNDEAAFSKLYKEPKELEEYRQQMYKSKPSLEDVKKKQAWNIQALPYIQEIGQCELNKKLEQEEKGRNK